MNQNLFLSNIAEIQISYSTKVKPSDRPKITCSKDAYEIFQNIFPSLEHREYFYILILNRGNQVLGFFEVSKGGVSGTVVDIKLILQTALKTNGSAIIACHNHPSGNTQVSHADEKITRKIKTACTYLDISFLDHLVITTETYLSMADEGII
jgi:DNA repair protein RadC